LRRVPAPRMNLSPTLGRARLPPSRQPPREGEAPAEPRVETNGCYCGVWVDLFHHGIHGIHGNTTERLSRCLRVPTVVVHERSRPWWGEAPAEPRDSAAWQGFGSAGASPSQRQRSAQQELRPPKGSVRLSRSFAPPKGSVRLSRSFALPKAGVRLSRSFALPKTGVRLCRSFALPKTGVRLCRSFALPKGRRSAQRELRPPEGATTWQGNLQART
jgi:hypothetical protein